MCQIDGNCDRAMHGPALKYVSRVNGEREKLVDRNTVLEYAYSADHRSLRDRSPRSDRLAPEAAAFLTVGEALIVVGLLSLGLWAAIWLAVSSLASALAVVA